MNHNTPLSHRPLSRLSAAQQVLTARQLRGHGVTSAAAARRCRPGGPWQQLLPGVYLLHSGPPTGRERLLSALLFAGRTADSVPPQPEETGSYGDAMVTGLAALALHGFTCAPPLPALERIDVLLPRTRRLRSSGHARLVKAAALPRADQVGGLPVAPVPRALADAVAQLTDAAVVGRLLTEAVRGGHCEAAGVVRELTRQRLLTRPYVADAVDTLIAEGRGRAEDRLYRMVAEYALPDPLWFVELRLPGGPRLGGVDAYWPDHGVAVELDCRAAGQDTYEAERWAEQVRRRESLEQLGIAVVQLTPRELRDGLEEPAERVRAVLAGSAELEPSAYVVVLPR
ncbi:hypothetical protein SRB5_52800 [Streptomyces sp. RB5]|uniref:DUF559 domain-containing protein n=1 Tax=Streptomyces smaragdinus TaxID=2585196 RepID=A0A7K0CQ13_9ACTN|nr:hypothetical protein [Streptomyces smaragdinus]MQY15102.1 hypothetical protein [Streptomyces smaragdinus]